MSADFIQTIHDIVANSPYSETLSIEAKGVGIVIFVTAGLNLLFHYGNKRPARRSPNKDKIASRSP
jgi:hypothetical protein